MDAKEFGKQAAGLNLGKLFPTFASAGRSIGQKVKGLDAKLQGKVEQVLDPPPPGFVEQYGLDQWSPRPVNRALKYGVAAVPTAAAGTIAGMELHNRHQLNEAMEASKEQGRLNDLEAIRYRVALRNGLSAKEYAQSGRRAETSQPAASPTIAAAPAAPVAPKPSVSATKPPVVAPKPSAPTQSTTSAQPSAAPAQLGNVMPKPNSGSLPAVVGGGLGRAARLGLLGAGVGAGLYGTHKLLQKAYGPKEEDPAEFGKQAALKIIEHMTDQGPANTMMKKLKGDSGKGELAPAATGEEKQAGFLWKDLPEPVAMLSQSENVDALLGARMQEPRFFARPFTNPSKDTARAFRQSHKQISEEPGSVFADPLDAEKGMHQLAGGLLAKRHPQRYIAPEGGLGQILNVYEPAEDADSVGDVTVDEEPLKRKPVEKQAIWPTNLAAAGLGAYHAPPGKKIQGALRGSGIELGTNLGATLGQLGGMGVGGAGGAGLGYVLAHLTDNKSQIPEFTGVGAGVGGLLGALAGTGIGGVKGYKFSKKHLWPQEWSQYNATQKAKTEDEIHQLRQKNILKGVPRDGDGDGKTNEAAQEKAAKVAASIKPTNPPASKVRTVYRGTHRKKKPVAAAMAAGRQ